LTVGLLAARFVTEAALRWLACHAIPAALARAPVKTASGRNDCEWLAAVRRDGGG